MGSCFDLFSIFYVVGFLAMAMISDKYVLQTSSRIRWELHRLFSFVSTVLNIRMYEGFHVMRLVDHRSSITVNEWFFVTLHRQKRMMQKVFRSQRCSNVRSTSKFVCPSRPDCPIGFVIPELMKWNEFWMWHYRFLSLIPYVLSGGISAFFFSRKKHVMQNAKH